MALTTMILAAMTLLGTPERVPPNEELATSIAAAVEDEPDAMLWAMRMTVYAYAESRFGYYWDGTRLVFDECRSGDGGRALGYYQEQQTPRYIACSSLPASREWLRMARRSMARCRSLAALASGRCDRGLRVTRFRERETARVMREVISE